MEGPVVTKL